MLIGLNMHLGNHAAAAEQAIALLASKNQNVTGAECRVSIVGVNRNKEAAPFAKCLYCL